MAIVGVLKSVDGFFAVDHENGLMKISETQAKDLESQLNKLHNKSSEETLEEKCFEFLRELTKLAPLILSVYSLYKTKQNLDSSKEILELQNNDDHSVTMHVRLANRDLINVADSITNRIRAREAENGREDTMQEQKEKNLEDISKDQNELSKTYQNLASNQRQMTQSKIQNHSLAVQTNNYQSDFYLKTAGVVLTVAENPEQIIKNVKNLFVIGADIISTVASNIWNWMTTPKAKPVDTITHIVETPEIKEAQEFAEYSYEADQEHFYDEMKPMGDFEAAAAA